jgi:hypothetical protein
MLASGYTDVLGPEESFTFVPSASHDYLLPPTTPLSITLFLRSSSVLAQQFDHASRNMDTVERNGKLDPVPDISPDGDVVLVVGSRNVRLRIQSQCLRCASKVFGAMFRPHWSEGQGLSKESPREVPLVEDDADALRTICCVLHHRNDDVPQSLTPKEVLQIAIEADKYGLNVALKYARVQWLKPRGSLDTVEWTWDIFWPQPSYSATWTCL